MIRWIAKRLIERGHGAPKFHGVAHDALAEAEATQPHHHAVAAAGRAGADRARLEPGGDQHDPRRADARRADLRRDLPAVPRAHRRGHGQARASKARSGAAARRCATRRRRRRSGRASPTARSRSIPPTTRRTGSTRPRKIPRGEQTTFKEMANGVPGIEMRLPILFSEGVLKKRLTINQFVALGGDQPRAHVRPVPAQGHHRGRLRRRHRDLESGDREDASTTR